MAHNYHLVGIWRAYYELFMDKSPRKRLGLRPMGDTNINKLNGVFL
jgi:hypothetical protein